MGKSVLVSGIEGSWRACRLRDDSGRKVRDEGRRNPRNNRTRMHRQAIALAASLALLVGATACQGNSPTGIPYAQATGSSLSTHSPANLAGSELLYAATLDWNSGTGSVYMYNAYGKDTSPIRSVDFQTGFPDGVWTDPRGDVVAVVNAGSNGRGYVNVYTPGLKKLLRTYADGLDGPWAAHFDRAGNTYVANSCGVDPQLRLPRLCKNEALFKQPVSRIRGRLSQRRRQTVGISADRTQHRGERCSRSRRQRVRSKQYRADGLERHRVSSRLFAGS